MTKTMIKKSIRAYNTRRQFVLGILLYGKVIRLSLCKPLKHEIDGILKVLVILAGFAGVYHVKQRGKVLLCLRRFVPDVPDQRRIVEPFGL